MFEVIDARLDDRPFRSRLGAMAAHVAADRWVLLWRDDDQWFRLGTPGTRDGLLARVAAGAPGRLDRVAADTLDAVGPRLRAAGLDTLSAVTLDADRSAVVFFEEPQRALSDLVESSGWFAVALDTAVAAAGAVDLSGWAPDLSAMADGDLALDEALPRLAAAFGFTAVVFAVPTARGALAHTFCIGPEGEAVSGEVSCGAEFSTLASSPEQVLGLLRSDRRSARWSSMAGDHASLLAVEGLPMAAADLELVADLLGHAVHRRNAADSSRAQIRQAERTRLATTLHEELSQQLSALTIEVDMLARREGAEPVAAGLADLRSGVVDALESLRSAIFELTPPEPDWTQLEAGLARFVEDHAAARGIRADYHVRGDARPIDTDAVSLVFATVQEALSNVAKHAGTDRARVAVHFEPDVAEVLISDDGVGIGRELHDPVDREHQGLGLLHTRARLAGADLDVSAGAESGTVVRLGVPTRQPAEVLR